MEMWIQVVKSFDLAKVQSSYYLYQFLNISLAQASMYNFACVYINRTIMRFTWELGTFGNRHTRPTASPILNWAWQNSVRAIIRLTPHSYPLTPLVYLFGVRCLKVALFTAMGNIELDRDTGSRNWKSSLSHSRRFKQILILPQVYISYLLLK